VEPVLGDATPLHEYEPATWRPRAAGPGARASALGSPQSGERFVRLEVPVIRSLLSGLRGSYLVPAVLSTTAGAVDVIGFLALGGLFTAHISGNLCVLAAHYITGGFNQVGPLLSVPVFIAVLGVVTRAFGRTRIRVAGRGGRSWSCTRPPLWPAWDWGSGSVPSPTPIPRWRYSRACSRSRQWPPRMRW
jgi:hypothetical protein